MSQVDTEAADRCPVDHTTRQKWLDVAKENRSASNPPTAPPPNAATYNSPPSNPLQLLHQHGLTKFSLDNSRWEPDWSRLVVQRTPHQSPPSSPQSLPTDREISTIPRAAHDSSPLNSAERAALPANNEQETAPDAKSGNWIYPSQQMFYAAMKRKGHTPSAADMATIVPIHNAVNERAWSEIKSWEAAADPEAEKTCGGPRLVSFAGDSARLTPRARWMAWVGYTRPFDRHDWVVERCDGRRVEYVIDFYSGKGAASDDAGSGGGGPGGGLKGKGLSFYLDVRPKLNSWEGVRMRGLRAVGWNG